MNIILTNNGGEHPMIDTDHVFVCIGQNCWGVSPDTWKIAHKLAKQNAPRGAKQFITRVAPKAGLTIDGFDGSLSWDAAHDAKICPICTVGKGLYLRIE